MVVVSSKTGDRQRAHAYTIHFEQITKRAKAVAAIHLVAYYILIGRRGSVLGVFTGRQHGVLSGSTAGLCDI